MIELFAADTPNGKKISIMLEEINYDYKVTIVDGYNALKVAHQIINKINPSNKIN